MRYIDTERQLADIFTKPLDSSHFAALQGGLVFAILMACFEGGVDVLSCIFVSFAFLLHFLHTHLSHFASPVILACICLIMLITVLG
jgi:RsiW-degrading membrane proteinase PrsW (M82 family)